MRKKSLPIKQMQNIWSVHSKKWLWVEYRAPILTHKFTYLQQVISQIEQFYEKQTTSYQQVIHQTIDHTVKFHKSLTKLRLINKQTFRKKTVIPQNFPGVENNLSNSEA